MAESWKKLKTSMCFRRLLCVRIEIDQHHSNNPLFVRQLYEDKSLLLRTHDLIFLTTDLQTVNSLLELIYFLNDIHSLDSLPVSRYISKAK